MPRKWLQRDDALMIGARPGHSLHTVSTVALLPESGYPLSDVRDFRPGQAAYFNS